MGRKVVICVTLICKAAAKPISDPVLFSSLNQGCRISARGRINT